MAWPGSREFAAIRKGLANLPRASHHAPGQAVDPSSIVMVQGHKAALDPDRALVVGNRGMGKSFWAHALADHSARNEAAKMSRELIATDVFLGFNASERTEQIAPTKTTLEDALRKCDDPDVLWRAVLVRVAEQLRGPDSGPAMPRSFVDLVEWVRLNGEGVDSLLTDLDDHCVKTGRKVLVVFDALDRLGDDWKTTRRLTAALLKRALAARSYRAIRLKLFMRRDQFEDPALFQFPDSSKIKNTRVELNWSSGDLYDLLFARLAASPDSSKALSDLNAALTARTFLPTSDRNKLLVDAIAGEYMGANEKRGRVFTWLPLHLSDARGETSPRTFLTAWREAAVHGPPPVERAVDHLGLIEGVRKASEDRVQELKEDYWWIGLALDPLRGEMVPMERSVVFDHWREHSTASDIRAQSRTAGLAPVQLEESNDPEGALLAALIAIGIVEERMNGKINVPDIFRVEAGIKRKGGVKPPARRGTAGR